MNSITSPTPATVGSNPTAAVTPADFDRSAHLLGRCLVVDHSGMPLGYRCQGENGTYVAIKLCDSNAFRAFDTKEGAFWWLLGEEFAEIAPTIKTEVKGLLGDLPGLRLEFEPNEIALVEPNGYPRIQFRWFGPKGLGTLRAALVAAGGRAADAAPGWYMFDCEQFAAGPFASLVAPAATVARVFGD